MKAKLVALSLRAGKVVAALALTFVVYNVNTCCALFAYQPELPEGTERFKKF